MLVAIQVAEEWPTQLRLVEIHFVFVIEVLYLLLTKASSLRNGIVRKTID